MALDRLHRTVVVEGRPSAEELLSLLRQQSLSVVLNVSTLSDGDKLDYLAVLSEVIEAERAAWGLPHWIVVDEAHVTLSEGGIAADIFRPSDGGYCLVTYHPEQLCAEATAALDVVITAEPYAGAIRAGGDGAGRRAALRERGSPERRFIVGARHTLHVRHRHKYAITSLPEQRWFHFRRPDGHVVGTARNLAEFERILNEVDITVVEHHLRHGDFSRWMLGSLQDRELAASVGAIGRGVIARHAADLRAARERISEQVSDRYALPGAQARADHRTIADRDPPLRSRVERAVARSGELRAEVSALAAQFRQTQTRRKPNVQHDSEEHAAAGEVADPIADRQTERNPSERDRSAFCR